MYIVEYKQSNALVNSLSSKHIYDYFLMTVKNPTNQERYKFGRAAIHVGSRYLIVDLQ